jgi:nucleoside-diphosphate-sugar epimerase
MKRILITGASGFIGEWLVDEALKRGYEVLAGVRSSSRRKYDGNTPRLRYVALNYDDIDVLTSQLSVLKDDDIEGEGAFRYVIHNAGLTKTLNVSDFYRVNTQYVKNLVEALSAAGCAPSKFLLMSSLSAYGPVKECGGTLSEEAPQHPDSHYGKSKLLAEQYLKAQQAFPYIILQPTGVYGPGDKDYQLQIDSIRRGFDFRIGFKPQRLSFIFAGDLSRAAFDALECETALNTSYIVADGDVHTADDFTDAVRELTGTRFVLKVTLPIWACRLVCLVLGLLGKLSGKPPTLNPDKFRILKQRNWACDTNKLRNELNFVPEFDLKNGLKQVIKKN